MKRIRKPLALQDNSYACNVKNQENAAILDCKDDGFLPKSKGKKSKKFSTKEGTDLDQENICIQNRKKYSLRKRLITNVKEGSSRKRMSNVSLKCGNSPQKASLSCIKIEAEIQSNEKTVARENKMFSKNEALDSSRAKKKSVLQEKNIVVQSAKKKAKWLREKKASPSKEEENLKPDSKFPKRAKCVYAKFSPDSAEKGACTRKNGKEYDVYDIAQDEDISHDKPVPKGKRRARRRIDRDRTALNKKVRNKKPEAEGARVGFQIKEDGCLSSILRAGVERSNIEEGDGTENIPCSAPPRIESSTVLGLEQESPQEPVSNSPARSLASDVPEICVEKHSIETSVLQSIMEDFEKSLMIPQWTSTPGNTSVCCKFPHRSKPIVPIDVSRIPAVASCGPNGALLRTPSNSPEKTATYESPNIHLFDSPPKKVIENIRKQNHARKKIVLDLLEQREGVDDLKEGVLKPRKSYHSPDILTRHIIRVKRSLQQQKSHSAKQSKSEQLMAEMNREFDEIDSLELCIE